MRKRDDSPSLTLISVKKIWDYAEHNALTDLLRYGNKWFCTFRESEAHVYGTDGAIRILSSVDGIAWKSVAYLQQSGVDLRDPKLSITPNGRLMLLVGGTTYKGKQYITRQPNVSFSDDGENWEPFQKILSPHEWLWRLTWFEGKGYGVSYSFADPNNRSKEWIVRLFSTRNGRDYEQIIQWDISGKPNECTLRFLNDGTMVALLRREERGDRNSWIGHSRAPYARWKWHQTKHHIGGPNFLLLPTGEILASGRIEEINPYGYYEKTALIHMTLEELSPLLYLPSGGVDCSYPGMFFYEGILWISYYSSHEEKTAIYLAKVQISPQKR